MIARINHHSINEIPTWVPTYAVRYLAHTEKGVSIRELARHSNCHASTILRQIRRIEARRDDPLFDGALNALGAQVALPDACPAKDKAQATPEHAPLSDDVLQAAAVEVLSGLSHAGAVLAIAPGLEKAAVVREGLDGKSERIATVDRTCAEAMALKDWISCQQTGRVSRYVITPEGRNALQSLLAKRENAAQGFCEDQSAFSGATDALVGSLSRVRFHSNESPLELLGRRRGKDGKPFLSRDLIRAGERLREDFELAHLEPGLAQDWQNFLTPPPASRMSEGASSAPTQARNRVTAALETLGDGLSDVVLRCCCYMEGMEATEKRLGWPARSGKVVLRIALTRLRQHYHSDAQEAGNLIW